MFPNLPRRQPPPKSDPQLTITPNPATATVSTGYCGTTAEVSRLGNGAISVDNEAVIVDDTSLTFKTEYGNKAAKEGDQFNITVTVAETDEYEAATAAWIVDIGGYATPEMPDVPTP